MLNRTLVRGLVVLMYGMSSCCLSRYTYYKGCLLFPQKCQLFPVVEQTVRAVVGHSRNLEWLQEEQVCLEHLIASSSSATKEKIVLDISRV